MVGGGSGGGSTAGNGGRSVGDETVIDFSLILLVVEIVYFLIGGYIGRTVSFDVFLFTGSV